MVLWWYLVHTFITRCFPDLWVQACILTLFWLLHQSCTTSVWCRTLSLQPKPTQWFPKSDINKLIGHPAQAKLQVNATVTQMSTLMNANIFSVNLHPWVELWEAERWDCEQRDVLSHKPDGLDSLTPHPARWLPTNSMVPPCSWSWFVTSGNFSSRTAVLLWLNSRFMLSFPILQILFCTRTVSAHR